MPLTALVGAQWGDEGKGKISFYYARQADIVARFSGGNNAGHTVIADGKKFHLHLLPSSVFYPDKVSVLGNGMVIDPISLFAEMEMVRQAGYPCKNILISPLAHLVFPFHQEMDRLLESERGKKAIGTTRKGIGPAYCDKMERTGIRVVDLLSEEILQEKLRVSCRTKKSRFPEMESTFQEKELFETFQPYGEMMRPMISDISKLLTDSLRQGKSVLCEGAQGTMLDVDFGTYPYVTSSTTTVGGVLTGLGVPAQAITEVLGITKAYTTRVGEGNFPTEETGKIGDFLREQGGEYGTTTGRPRRCGWLDGIVLKYGARLNGYSGLVITKLDIFRGIQEIKFCEAYRHDQDLLTEFPFSEKIFSAAQPVYRTFPSWDANISTCKKMSELPKSCREFLSYIEEYTKVPIRLVSVGADRDQVISP